MIRGFVIGFSLECQLPAASSQLQRRCVCVRWLMVSSLLWQHIVSVQCQYNVFISLRFFVFIFRSIGINIYSSMNDWYPRNEPNSPGTLHCPHRSVCDPFCPCGQFSWWKQSRLPSWFLVVHSWWSPDFFSVPSQHIVKVQGQDSVFTPNTQGLYVIYPYAKVCVSCPCVRTFECIQTVYTHIANLNEHVKTTKHIVGEPRCFGELVLAWLEPGRSVFVATDILVVVLERTALAIDIRVVGIWIEFAVSFLHCCFPCLASVGWRLLGLDGSMVHACIVLGWWWFNGACMYTQY